MMKKCEEHSGLIQRLASIEAKTDLILDRIKIIEKYAVRAKSDATESRAAITASVKMMGMSAAIAAAVAAVINVVVH
jgi:hypothetical protein